MKLEFITKQDFEQFKSDITNMLTTISSNAKPKIWLRSKEVREMLGISPGTLQNMRIHGHIPFTKLGGTLFYDADEIDKILNDNKIVN
jgi:hypothetical protein